VIALPWFLVPAVTFALFFLGARRQRLRLFRITDWTPEHQAGVAQLNDWLTNEDIQKALITTGTCTLDGMESIADRLYEMDEATVWATTAALTRDRRVRRVIADYAHRVHGLSKHGAMEGLRILHEGGKRL
jgi:hypothetical protein